MTFRKILLGGGASIIILLIGFGLFCYHVVTKSFPQTEGKISGLDVSSPVKIFRDPYGIPHVIATNEDDAYFAIGFLHAQERLFQMDIQRRAGEGRLSEIFGTRTIPYDAMFRTIGIERTAERIEASLRPEVKRALEDYSRGVNAYIEQNRRRMPVEFDMLNYKPEPWTPLHTIILTRMMAWELNMGWWGDIALQDVINKVGMKDALELFPQYPADAPTIMQEEHPDAPQAAVQNKGTAYAVPISAPSAAALRDFALTDKAFHDFIGYPHYQTGSNAWAVSPQKSTTGKPILCNDPHLVITTPSPWYQVHISAGTLNVAGYTLPGDPFIVIGRNNAVAWGETNAMLDDCDFIVEQLDSAKSSRYLLHGIYQDMKIINDTIHVKDTENVVVKIYQTEHGPIVSAVHPFNYPVQLFKQDGLRSDSSSMLRRTAIAMHWMGSEVTDENYTLWKFNHAKSARDIIDGAQYFGCPAQNFVYADTAGNIGYVLGGKVPLRATPIPGESVPVPGAQESEIWNSFVPFAQQPKFQNPKSGFIAAANNKISDRMGYYFTNIWEPPSRIERIDALLQSRQKLTPDDMKRMQYDYISPYAFDLTHYIIAAFPDSAAQQPLVKQALTYFSNWDGSMSKEVIAASVFNMWMEKMFEEMFKTRLGEPVYEEYLFLQSLPQRALAALMHAPESDWFDDPRTPQRETRDDMIRKCLLEALQDLTARFNSTEMKRWQWGEMHHVIFKHVLGEIKPLDKVLNIGPLPAGGCLTTINNAQFSLIHPYDSDLGPSMRMICDMSEKDMLSVITSGESGQPFSRHYNDQTGLWLNGGYIDITLDRSRIPQAGWEQLVLEK